MKWYQERLKENGRKIFVSAITLTVFVVSTLLWSYFSGESFVWTKYEPLSYPTIGSVGFYSALAFRTLGAVLFSGGFYLFLYKISGSRREFNRNKRDVWKMVVIATFGLTVLVFWIINSVLSVIFNLIMFIVFLLPPVLITFGLIVSGYLVFKKFLPKEVVVLQERGLDKGTQ